MEHFPKPKSHLMHPAMCKQNQLQDWPLKRQKPRRPCRWKTGDLNDWYVCHLSQLHIKGKPNDFPSYLDVVQAPPTEKLQRIQSFWLSIITLPLQGGDLCVTVLNVPFLVSCCVWQHDWNWLWLTILISMKAMFSTDKPCLDLEKMFFTQYCCCTCFVFFSSL